MAEATTPQSFKLSAPAMDIPDQLKVTPARERIQEQINTLQNRENPSEFYKISINVLKAMLGNNKTTQVS